MKRQRIASVISTEVEKSLILFINALVSDEIERLTRSSPGSLAATLAAQPSMSLVPLAPFLDFTRNDERGSRRNASRRTWRWRWLRHERQPQAIQNRVANQKRAFAAVYMRAPRSVTSRSADDQLM